MTTEESYETILDEADHLHRMPRHGSATPLNERDYIRGRLPLMITNDAVYRAEHEGPEYTETDRRHREFERSVSILG